MADIKKKFIWFRSKSAAGGKNKKTKNLLIYFVFEISMTFWEVWDHINNLLPSVTRQI